MKFFIAFIFSGILTFNCYSQDNITFKVEKPDTTEKEKGWFPLTGAYLGVNGLPNYYLEIGCFGTWKREQIGHKYRLKGTRGKNNIEIYTSLDLCFEFLLDQKFLIGHKLSTSFWYSEFYQPFIKLDFVIYSDYDIGEFVFRPNIGGRIGKNIRLYYGYNFDGKINRFEEYTNTHHLSLYFQISNLSKIMESTD